MTRLALVAGFTLVLLGCTNTSQPAPEITASPMVSGEWYCVSKSGVGGGRVYEATGMDREDTEATAFERCNEHYQACTDPQCVQR
ncbi:hypothetical protein IDSA_05620 [Pseudidiomarina salinarum]|uniref:Lipoprotein n=1 Tax=Pseudidiomarina salinarum TaxID=435908 RepID=A0A094IW36_9GAMM|nr:hypothetical protein [Pseudidiomarina salinarum]KFZ30069.1 hypothetical protein IDSA_05620 [Pseudidiomarina salinarum]RUO70038.1 hypothetical protein CWI79_00800 [Pseudidiomarina salinarum]